MNKHQFHDDLVKHVTDWAKPFGVTFDKHELDEILGIKHVKSSLDQLTSGNNDVSNLREALAFTGGMADFMASKGANDPFIPKTVDAIKGLLS